MVEAFDDGGFACGLAADGLPVVAPRRELVDAMLAGADPRLSLGACPPSQRDCRLWQAAACAVLAGAEPRQFPVVVAAVRAALDPAFNALGAGATTDDTAMMQAQMGMGQQGQPGQPPDMGKIFAAEAEYMQIVEHKWFLDAAEERLLKSKTAGDAGKAAADKKRN